MNYTERMNSVDGAGPDRTAAFQRFAKPLLACALTVALPALSWAVGEPCTQDTQCEETEYCRKAVGDCGGAGTCQPVPGAVCPPVWIPVCGCDGTTYSNECTAETAGVSVDYAGECLLNPPPTPTAVSASDGLFDDRIRVTWNDVPGEAEYWIYRDEAVDGPYTKRETTAAGVTSWDDPHPCGRTFYYKVVAMGSTMGSTPSVPNAGSTTDCPPTTYTVCETGCDFSEINQAIITSSDGDTVLVRDGVYFGGIDFRGKAITVRSENGPVVTALDAWGILGMDVVTFDSGEGRESVLEGFTVRNGYGAFGGAVAIWHSSPTIRNCRVIESRAQDSGGGIYCHNASPLIVNTVVSGNFALYGGGIVLTEASELTLVNSTVAGNHSTGWAGGIAVGAGATLTMVNSVVWGNAGDTLADDVYLSPTGTTSVSYSNIRLDDPGQTWAGTGNMNLDPLFVDQRPAAEAPTDGGDYHLRLSSPCIDAGTGTFPDLSQDDLDGDARPQGAGPEIGADEYLAATSDSDGDGVADAVDCAPLDPSISPSAAERPSSGGTCDDGIDNDCDDLTDSSDDSCRGDLTPVLLLLEE